MFLQIKLITDGLTRTTAFEYCLLPIFPLKNDDDMPLSRILFPPILPFMRETVEARTSPPSPHHHLLDAAKVVISEEESLITGTYTHELTLHRAKKLWQQVLESYFLLDRHTDFLIKTRVDHEKNEYALWCFFTSACGRYACWRIAHDHAPEALALIEIAHIPQSPSMEMEKMSAPNATVTPPSYIEKSIGSTMSIMDTVKSLLHKILQHQKEADKDTSTKG